MCAPRKLLPVLAIAGLAVATGGLSLGATTAATTAATTSTIAPLAAGNAGALAAQTSTLSNLGTALKVGLKYANIASPLIGSAGLVYSGQIQKGILEQQAMFSSFQSAQEEETYALRKDQRRRRLAQALGKQRALYGISGVKLEETPTDILTQTARSFAEDDFYDRYGTSGRMLSASLSADNLRQSGRQAELGGLLDSTLTLSRRGVV